MSKAVVELQATDLNANGGVYCPQPRGQHGIVEQPPQGVSRRQQNG